MINLFQVARAVLIALLVGFILAFCTYQSEGIPTKKVSEPKIRKVGQSKYAVFLPQWDEEILLEFEIVFDCKQQPHGLLTQLNRE